MTDARWVIGDLGAAAAGASKAIGWIVRAHSYVADQALASIRPTRADLADAALAREQGGTGRLLRRRLLRALAAQVLGLPPDKIAISRSRAGALSIPELELYASVAGSGEYHLVALSHQPIGVDIEILAEGGCASAAYLRDWTAREAYLKALGVGLRVNPETIELATHDEGFNARISRHDVGQGEWAALSDLVAALVMLPPAGMRHPTPPEIPFMISGSASASNGKLRLTRNQPLRF